MFLVCYSRMLANLLKTLVFTVLVPGTVAGYIPYVLRGRTFQPATAALALLGGVPLAAGLAVYLWCAWDFATAGRGTPLPLDAPRRLVVRGLYRFVRNPMYVGVLLVILGQAILFASTTTLWYAVAVAVFFQSFVIFYEEPALFGRFGESYADYRTRVPRWIPRLSRKTV
jgi:protein-S-isoprenylcysteine O-methyltransferase Ste14